MWSYKDSQGKIHTRLFSAQIRELIIENRIREDTPLLNHQFNTWIPAKETLFFKIKAVDLPDKKSLKKAPNKSIEPPVSAPKQAYKAAHLKQLILIVVLALIAILPISYQLFNAYKKERHLNQLEDAYIRYKDLLNDKQIAKSAYLDAKDKYNIIYQTISYAITQEDKDKEKNLRELTKQKMLEAEVHYKNFNYVDPQTRLPTSIKRAQKVLLTMQENMLYYLLTLVPLYLYCVFMHFKACKVVLPKGKKYLFIWILHSIPLLQFFFYAILSAKWNLESTQRKNSLYYTLPLTLSLLISLSFSFYFFNFKISQSLFLLLFSIILWGIVQFRQTSMIQYSAR